LNRAFGLLFLLQCGFDRGKLVLFREAFDGVGETDGRSSGRATFLAR